MRVLLSETLRIAGHEVADFGTGEDAVAWDGWPGCDVAVIDWMMPQMSGFELLRWLSDHHPGVRCLIVTAAKRALLDAHPDVVDLAAMVLSKEELTIETVADLV